MCLDLMFAYYGTSHFSLPVPLKRKPICNALTRQIHRAAEEKNIGKWAQLQQKRIKFLPYDTHKGLQEARRLSFVHRWYVAVTPPHFLVYVIFNIHMGILYIGQTHLAADQRLRKHLTDAAAGVDCSALHKLMASSAVGD